MKTLFTVRMELGTHAYYDDGTCAYDSKRTNEANWVYSWRWHEGKVEWRDPVKQGFWSRDADAAQKAYQDYIARLVLEEP